MTHQQIVEALGQVQEPDLGKDLISLNMVKDIEIVGNNVAFTLILTTPACPMKNFIENACVNAIQLLVNPQALVKINFTSNTTTLRKELGTLPTIKNIIAVVSGKGGVGKSTVAANFALALAQKGARVGLLDADIYGPSVPIMFGVRGERPKMTEIDNKPQIVPLEKYGIKLLSIGLLVDEKSAVVWRGPMASSALKQLITEVYWGDLDYLVVDMPPGTGDIHLTLVQTAQVSGAIVVTTPQEVALIDAQKAIAMFAQAQTNIPIIGLVENMSYYCSTENPEQKQYIFGKEGGKRLAEEYEIPFLGQIPITSTVRQGGDEGLPAMVGTHEIDKQYFEAIANQAIRNIAINNAGLKR